MPFQKGHTINKGKKYSIEHRRKISFSNSGIHRWVGKTHPRGMLGKKHTEEWKINMRRIQTGSKHKPMSEQGKINIGLVHKGQKAWNKGLTVKTDDRVRKYIEKISGDKNYNWKGGVTTLYKKIRKSSEYKLWRNFVFQRDNFTCVWCGQRGGQLQPDHIKPFAEYPELRFTIENGRTLCLSCHRKTETWGRNINIQSHV